MTNEELFSVAEIVERATNRFNEQAARFRERSAAYDRLITDMNADHERKMAEHRAAFGARTEADAKIIEGLRAAADEQVLSASKVAYVLRCAGETPVQAAQRVVKERDGLLTQVQDMRAEMERLSAQLGWERAEIKRLQWENATMHKDAEDGYAEAIKVLGDPIALSKERDVLRAEVADLKTQLERLTSWAAKNQAARETLQTEIERLKSQMAEQEVSVVGVINERNEAWERCDALRAEVAALQERLRASIARGDFAQIEVAALKSQTPKQHPVAVGAYVKRLTGFNTTPAGEIGRVTRVDDDDDSEVEYEVKRPNGETGVWCASNCEPCDPPTEVTHDTPEGRSVAESAVKVDPKPGDTVRLVRVPTHTDIPAMLPWSNAFGIPGDTATVETMARPEKQPSGTIPVRTEMGRCFYWPLSCVEVVRAEPDKIKVGDVVEVFQATDSNWTRADEIGIKGTVTSINMGGHMIPVVYLSNNGAYALQDVRKVTP